MAIQVITKSKSGKTVMYGTEEGHSITTIGTINGSAPVKGGRFLVEYGSRFLMKSVVDGRDIMVPNKEYFDFHCDAMQFFLFQQRHERFVEAKDAGLDDATAELIAQGKMTLEAALGDMDMDLEVHGIEVEEYFANADPDDFGGEDDNTPPLEVMMAGGWAAWEYQNEKNAVLDRNW